MKFAATALGNGGKKFLVLPIFQKKAGGPWKRTARLQLNSRRAPDTWPNASRQIRVGLSASTVMMETACEYCISTVEIQYGFHKSQLSSRHTNAVYNQIWH